MTENSPLNEDQRRLLDAYHKLSPEQQTLVQLLSVTYTLGCSRTVLGQCLSGLGIRAANGKQLSSALVDAYLQWPLESQLVVEKSGAGQKNRIICNPLFMEIAARLAVDEKQFDALAERVSNGLKLPGLPLTKYSFVEAEQVLCAARICFYRGAFAKVSEYLAGYKHRYGWQTGSGNFPDEIQFYRNIINNPFDPERFAQLPDDFKGQLLGQIQLHNLVSLKAPGIAFEQLRLRCEAAGFQDDDSASMVLIESLLLRGEWDIADDYLSNAQTPEMLAAQAWLQFLRGDNDAALQTYAVAFSLLKRKTGKRKVYFDSLSGLFWPVALIKAGAPQYLQQAEECLDLALAKPGLWCQALYALLRIFVNMLRGERREKDKIAALPMLKGQLLSSFFVAVLQYWSDPELLKNNVKALRNLHDAISQNGYRWLAAELANFLAAVSDNGKFGQEAQAFFSAGRHSLLEVFRPRQSWEMALDALTNLTAPEAAAQGEAQPSKTSRLAWWLRFTHGLLSVEPKEQVLNAKGAWSKGRAVALKRLQEDNAKLQFLSAEDRAACAYIQAVYESSSWGYGATHYEFKRGVALALAGHPLLFWADNPEVRVELVKGAPELRVEKQANDRLKITLAPQPAEELKYLPKQDIIVSKETPTRLKVVEFTPEHWKILDILGANGLEVPASAQAKVLQAIAAITPLLTVHSDIGGGVENVAEVAADPALRVHLLPFGEGLKVALLVRPFGNDGPYYPPGSGGATVLAEIGGQRLQTRRDLTEEKTLGKRLLEACTTLNNAAEEGGEYLLEDPEQCLEFLLELESVKEWVRVEWPEGQKFRLAGLAGLGQFSMQVRKERDWFGLDGEVRLDEQQVFNMQQLLGLLEHGKGRFVQLQDGQFLALTEEFRKRLQDFRAYAEQHGKGLRINPLAALALGDFGEDLAEFKADKHWKDHLQRLRAAQDSVPQLPSTFQAELRDYQLEGFQWLARLAQWGVGGCLADDMGLGKTIQALAAILDGAPQGPSLVVAPTSVCMNWENEAARFAPTLNVKLFGAGDRQKLLDKLQPFDLLICSYGLLQQEAVAEALAQVRFQTIVLDEAQAIKNIATRRSQAAMNLQADFKLITTGTPVENHLGELWNLFRFINPGLLGSLEKFNQRFAGPIERNQDKQARLQLRKLIQPFILRRTKAQVLQELPPRTEILIHVDLSPEETAFYEALRREALQKIADLQGPGGQKHLQILAEIMKLRRACCNVQLVKPEVALPSSKLEAFGEILDELLDNKHKALVFSQFVDHLRLLQAYLGDKGVTYQYLDGSTPAKERKQRVDAFQRGEGDLFLISLKAGGVGLNLTAADYVLHMDPWWNPAVEDQASDRAHRMGQQRPVTIYRFVARNTIEEKIVALHAHKRDLADSLLEGADVSGKMSAQELLALMSEE